LNVINETGVAKTANFIVSDTSSRPGARFTVAGSSTGAKFSWLELDL